jgi:hypothetical protein
MKTTLKGRRFHNINDIKTNTTANLNAFLLNTINDSFVQFSERSKKILDYDGLDMYREWTRIELPKEYCI